MLQTLQGFKRICLNTDLDQPKRWLKDISRQVNNQSLDCVSEIVGMTDLRSECREVIGHPRETETVPFGLGLAAALNSSSQAQKGSFSDQGRITFTPVTGLQLFAHQRSGQL